MNNKDLLTIIIITYRNGRYLFETIKSILEQEYHKIELIVAEDGAPDFSRTVVEEYIEHNKRQNLVSFTILSDGINRGTVKNINRALRIAQGNYIKLIAGDDTLSGNDVCIEQIRVLESNDNKELVVGKVQQCDAELNPIDDRRTEKSNNALPMILKMSYPDSKKYIEQHNLFPITTQAICFKREFFDAGGAFDEDYVLIEDIPMVFRILKNLDKVVYIDKICVNHRGDVGVSSKLVFFDIAKKKYYFDMLKIYEKEFEPELFGDLYVKEMVRFYKFACDMIDARNGKNNQLFNVAYLFLKYGDAVLYYVVKKHRQLFIKIKRIVKKVLVKS